MSSKEETNHNHNLLHDKKDEHSTPQDPAAEAAHQSIGSARLVVDQEITESNGVDKAELKLEEDMFSLIFVANIRSGAFFTATMFFVLQVTVLVLVIFNLLRDAPEGNPLKVPLRNTRDVTTAQALAIYISLLSQSDITTSLDLFHTRYNQLETFPFASRIKWILSNSCRMLVGILAIGASFIIVVQSTEVLELFFNFAAVYFISELDNIAFQLAMRGYFSPEVEKIAKNTTLFRFKSGQIKGLHVRLQSMTRIISIRALTLCLFLIALYTGWGVITARQVTGYYLNYVCQTFDVRFGDQYYDFFRGQECNVEVQDGCLWKNRTRPLHYGPFSDVYVAVKEEGNHNNRYKLKDDRPVYYQRGAVDGFGDGSPPGIISYCKEEEAWVFTIENVTKSRADSCNWLLRSPKTDAYSLHEAPMTGWSIWTGILVLAQDFSIGCAECENDVDCNYHGVCGAQDSKVCSCETSWVGNHCQSCAGCTELSETVALSHGTELKANETFILLDGTVLYNRPVYYRLRPIYYNLWGGDPVDSLVHNTSVDILFYAGTRFYIVSWENFLSEPRVIQEMDILRLKNFMTNYHSSWNLDDNINRTFYFYTEVTEKPMPIEVTWYKRTEATYINLVDELISGPPDEQESLSFDCAIDEERDACSFTRSSQNLDGKELQS